MFVLYLLFLVFLLCQETNDRHIGVSGFGRPSCPSVHMEETVESTLQRTLRRSFGCCVDTIFDEFFIGHILGWYGKAGAEEPAVALGVFSFV